VRGQLLIPLATQCTTASPPVVALRHTRLALPGGGRWVRRSGFPGDRHHRDRGAFPGGSPAWRNGVLSVVLALAVGELTSQSSTEQHLVAVADLRLTAATAIQLRAMIDKALLAAAPTPGAAN
jgi:hypothetical protein